MHRSIKFKGTGILALTATCVTLMGLSVSATTFVPPSENRAPRRASSGGASRAQNLCDADVKSAALPVESKAIMPLCRRVNTGRPYPSVPAFWSISHDLSYRTLL